jgi:cytochrome c peroxidase
VKLLRSLQILLGVLLTFAVGATVQAGNNKASIFSTSLFPTGFSAKVTSQLRVQAVNNMAQQADSSVTRQFAAHMAQVIASQQVPLAALGKELFFDTSLSNPAGQSCATCHSPLTGFTGPNSSVNLILGTVPGIVPGRFGNRNVPSVAYSVFSPTGPFYDSDFSAYAGGQFWDGRARNTTIQASFPFQNPNEMNNVLHNVADPALVVQHIADGPYSDFYKNVFGQDIFTKSVATNLECIGLAMSAYEQSPEVVPFSSKYDFYLAGKVLLSPAETRGLRLYSGTLNGRPGGVPNYKNAQCSLCHGIPSSTSAGPDIFSNFCYANIGVPRNPRNPYYSMTNQGSNPLGYNPLGQNYIDMGLGDFLYPAAGLPSGNNGNDTVLINGTFKAPSLRNVDKRPAGNFIKAYMHNGYFKSLSQVVHFYNTRNLTTQPGEVIDFTQPNPYAGLVGTPLWPAPEYVGQTLQNASGAPGSAAAQVGNLGLTTSEESDIVAFLKTLSDGWNGHN